MACLLASRLGLRYVDTGALYRAVAWWLKERGLDPEEEEELRKAVASCPLGVGWDEVGKMSVKCGSQDITEALRAEEIGMLASRISARRVIREYLWRIQRDMARAGQMVFEGRDTGSQVFPEADFRFFLTASREERARRRFLELKGLGVETSLEEVEEKMTLRDQQDASRDLAPLKVPQGGHVIDTTGLTPTEVVDRMLEVIQAMAR